MIAWRLCHERFALNLDGEGNRVFGARWNSPGRGIVYTASSLSLATLELLVHTDLDTVPERLVSVQIEIPGQDYPTLYPGQLPNPASFEWCRAQGDKWLDVAEALALVVPSVVVPVEQNILLNPRHADMHRVRILDIQPYRFDERLFK